MFIFLLLFVVKVLDAEISTNASLPKFPWSENVPMLEFTTMKPDGSNITRQGLIEEVKNGRIPTELTPFLNLTMVRELKKENNDTLDFIIRDEDVADIPDDEERKVNTITHDGNKTIITISDNAKEDLYKHWLDQSLSGFKPFKGGLTLDFIIRDEDVADISDDEERKVNTITHDGNKTIITISDNAKEDLYKHWLDQSLSGLMGAVVTNVINKRKLTKLEKMKHYNCTQSARTVKAHAICVVAVLDQVKKRDEKLKVFSTMTWKLNNSYRKSRIKNENWKGPINEYEKFVKSGAEEFRVKRAAKFGLFDEYEKQKEIMKRRNIKNQKSYVLKDQKTKSPMAIIAQRLTNLVRSMKNTSNPPKRWQQVIGEIKEETGRMKKKKRNKDRLKKKFRKFASVARDMGVDPKRALKTMGMENLFDDEPILTEKEQEKADREDAMSGMNAEEKMMHEPIKLVREGIKLAMVVTGKNVSNFDDKKLAILSPQFMSLLPDEKGNETVSLLSPSILSLHGEGNELEREISLNKAFKMLSDTGQDDWMNFVLEAAGVTESVQEMRDSERKADEEEIRRDFIDEKGRPRYFTRENVTEIYGEYEATKLDFLDSLYKSMSGEQMDALNTTGYAIMNQHQLNMTYGHGSPYNNTEAVEKFRNINETDMPVLIENNIRSLAKEEYKFEVTRKNDIVLNPLVLMSLVLDPKAASQSVILSPVLLTPLILSPAIYGNVILSPWEFVPVILSPRVLSPAILSPVVFSPVVLSPLCMTPVILSPSVGLPIILSPFVMAPFILSPTVLTPLILSPFCLSPFIGIANVLTPLVLSPFVLSPLILSPPLLSAFVLNPYALSPVVASDGALFTAVLSPSWLSTI